MTTIPENRGHLAHVFKIAWAPLWARTAVYCAAFFGVIAGLEALVGFVG